ncbi:MAG: SRPBCC domain-containing protein [Chryseolinea sp.]
MEIKQEGTNFIVNTTIRASREIVHKLLVEIVGLKQWWENPVKGTPVKGGQLRFEFQHSDEHTVMTVDSGTADKVQWTVVEDTGFNGEWVGTTIVFELRQMDEYHIELNLRHVGLTADLKSYEPCKGAWQYYLTNIKKVAEQRS